MKNRRRLAAALAAATLGCASGAVRAPQACAADTDCAADARCHDAVCVADAPPEARISGPGSAAVGEVTAFDGSGSSDQDDDIVDYIWSARVMAADCPPDVGAAGGATFRPVFGCPGEFEVILVVRDRTGVVSEPAIAPVTVGRGAP